MPITANFQIKNKRPWWLDVIFYFSMSLLVATVLCYLIFMFKNDMQKKDIQDATDALQTVGTVQQKSYEKDVVDYRQKINDFSELLKNHEFASNVLTFMGKNTMSSIWFNRFDLDKKNRTVQLLGQAESVEAFSRQVNGLEGNEDVSSISTLNSTLVALAKIDFELSLSLDPKLFNYTSSIPSVSETVSLSSGQTIEGSLDSGTETSVKEKSITSFVIPLSPDIIGEIDESHRTITLNIPDKTITSGLAPVIKVSPSSTVSPVSGASQDFSNPVTYTVTGEDGSTKDYTVVVNVLSEKDDALQQTKNRNLLLIVGSSLSVVVLLVIILTIFLLIKRRNKNVPR